MTQVPRCILEPPAQIAAYHGSVRAKAARRGARDRPNVGPEGAHQVAMKEVAAATAVIRIEDPKPRAQLILLRDLPGKLAARDTDKRHVVEFEPVTLLEAVVNDGSIERKGHQGRAQNDDVGLLRVTDRLADIMIEEILILDLRDGFAAEIAKPRCIAGPADRPQMIAPLERQPDTEASQEHDGRRREP
ncbi:hypothetical protein [Bradyrhizobium sp. ORS 375]|uniref:hypothetical protein n=1 Tax=Bradyrhizobium sp. (strain ORS 375) TaxID=566679 RepID=UPI001FCB47FA|nr:hypothetical protein [Bradyrhizobium sp. ORS 375]